MQLMFLRKLVARTLPRSRTKNKKHIPLNAAIMTTATSPFNIANPSRGPGETWLQSFVSGFIQDLFLSTFGHPGMFFAGSRIMRERKHQTVFVHRLICRLCWLSRPPSFRYVRGAESVLHTCRWGAWPDFHLSPPSKLELRPTERQPTPQNDLPGGIRGDRNSESFSGPCGNRSPIQQVRASQAGDRSRRTKGLELDNDLSVEAARRMKVEFELQRC